MPTRILASLLTLCLGLHAATGSRIKQLASIEGVRDNQLVGYGLVVGLNGTGDKRQTVFSAQTLTNLLTRMGVPVPPAAILVRNTAAVLVTSNLPPFGQPGTRIDVSVAAIGDATNLQGGLLILTALRASDGQVYAAAQGSVLTGGFVAGRGGNSQTLNHPTAGRVPAGAIIERAPPTVSPGNHLNLQLKQADFNTAARVSAAINKAFGSNGSIARAENAGLISITPPQEFAGRPVEFVAQVENILVDADTPAKVVLNERTGTIVIGKEVRIAPVSILHGALTVEIQTTVSALQPAPLSNGTTAITGQTQVNAKEDTARNVSLKPGATVEDLVHALAAIGSTARDVIAILQGLKAAGALDAELEVI